MKEQNTPKQLSSRQQYVKELTEVPYWNTVNRFQEVDGWKPGPEARKTLIQNEICDLFRDILENRKRIEQWKNQLPRARDEEQIKLVRMISRWTSYTNELAKLKESLRATLSA